MTGETAEAREVRLRVADHVHAAHAREAAGSFGPLVAMGTEILKAVALINGGAGAATIAFLAAALRDRPDLARGLVWPLGAFGFGLTVAACATGWSYFAQARYAEALRTRSLVPTPPFVLDTPDSAAARAAGDRYAALAQGAVMVGIASAVIGFAIAGWQLLRVL